MVSRKVKLTKISNNVNDLRTNSVEGTTGKMPVVGSYFSMAAESLTPENNVRLVSTSLIQEIDQISDSEVVFKTLNSTYRLEFLDEN